MRAEQRIGDWICVRSGVKYYPLDPRPEEVRLSDIAHALAMKVRWGGHPAYFYSVAAHCLRVAAVAKYLASLRPELTLPDMNLTKEQQERQEVRLLAKIELYALLHDAHEAYLADLPRPVKQFAYWRVLKEDGSEEFRRWRELEKKNDQAILVALDLGPPGEFVKAIVGEADQLLLCMEAEELFEYDHAGHRDAYGHDWDMPEVEISAELSEAAACGGLNDEHTMRGIATVKRWWLQDVQRCLKIVKEAA